MNLQEIFKEPEHIRRCEQALADVRRIVVPNYPDLNFDVEADSDQMDKDDSYRKFLHTFEYTDFIAQRFAGLYKSSDKLDKQLLELCVGKVNIWSERIELQNRIRNATIQVRYLFKIYQPEEIYQDDTFTQDFIYTHITAHFTP
jgi:hypothetical protein